MRDRSVLVLELIRNPQLVTDISEELAEYSWYCEEHLAIVSKQDVLDVLKKLENGVLTAVEVVRWANSVGGRTDIGFEFGADGVVEESLYWLANPEINGKIDGDMCHRIVALYERRGTKRQPH